MSLCVYTLYVIVAAMNDYQFGMGEGDAAGSLISNPLTEVMRFVQNLCPAEDACHDSAACREFSNISTVERQPCLVLNYYYELIMTNDGFGKLLLFDKPNTQVPLQHKLIYLHTSINENKVAKWGSVSVKSESS